MFKISLIATAISTLLPVVAMAQSIEGVVVNRDGKAIAGANVRVDGENTKTVTDSKGHFIFNKLNVGNNEIHISAANYAHLHQDIMLSDDEVKTLTLTLSRSPIEVFNCS